MYLFFLFEFIYNGFEKKKSTYIDSWWFYYVTIAQNHNESKFYTEYLVLIWLVDRLPVLCILLEFWLFFRIFNEIQNFNENQNYKQPYIIQNTSLFYFGLLFFFIRVMGFFLFCFFLIYIQWKLITEETLSSTCIFWK